MEKGYVYLSLKWTEPYSLSSLGVGFLQCDYLLHCIHLLGPLDGTTVVHCTCVLLLLIKLHQSENLDVFLQYVWSLVWDASLTRWEEVHHIDKSFLHTQIQSICKSCGESTCGFEFADNTVDKLTSQLQNMCIGAGGEHAQYPPDMEYDLNIYGWFRVILPGRHRNLSH